MSSTLANGTPVRTLAIAEVARPPKGRTQATIAIVDVIIKRWFLYEGTPSGRVISYQGFTHTYTAENGRLGAGTTRPITFTETQ